MKLLRSWVFGLGAILVSGCSSDVTSTGDESDSAIALALTTTTPSGAAYRLGPATFTITSDSYGSTPTTVDASGAESSLRVPLEPKRYTVTLQPDWVLSRVQGSTLTPVEATLTSPISQMVSVEPFIATPVNFAFHLGESGIDIGISVEEGIPEGYDARLVAIDSGRYSIEFRSGGGACCVSGLTEAQSWYPGLRIYVP